MRTETYGRMLRRILTEKSVSILELARRVEVHPNAIHKLLSGKHEPGVRRLVAIANALGVDPADFLPAFQSDRK